SDTAFGAVPNTPTALTPREVYETFYSTATIGGSDYASAALGLLWQRRNGQWKIVSYQTTWADASGTKPIPDLRKPAATRHKPAPAPPKAGRHDERLDCVRRSAADHR